VLVDARQRSCGYSPAPQRIASFMQKAEIAEHAIDRAAPPVRDLNLRSVAPTLHVWHLSARKIRQV